MVEIEFRKALAPASAEMCVGFAEEIERLGYSGFWYPHAIARDIPSLETLTVLAGVATRTSKIRIGTAVLQIPLYPPFALAQTLMTIDHLSNGRLVLGAGTGWLPHEFANLGLSFKERAGRTDEALQIIKRLWTEEEVTHEGKYYTLREARLIPKPVQKPHPKIIIGGVYNIGQQGYPGEKPRPVWSERAIRRIARVGDGWISPHVISPENAVEVFSEALERIRAAAREEGRTISDEEFELVAETSPFNVNENKQKAVEEALGLYSSRSARGFLQVAGNPSFEDLVHHGACGPAEEVAAMVNSWLAVKKHVPALKRIQLNIGSLDPIEQLRKFHAQVQPLLDQ
ncbi:MAG: LLM class flavin-dependent oxidoreductase [Chloroflexi bacterium]|nr:LLM class flavin-dependent oxidoreductase [Chloroflexota bacterium]